MPPAFDVAQAQRWFAIEFNNACWALVESERRTAEETERMLHLAHAAALHWAAIGTALNQQRADQLLAHACACAGQPSEALRYAERSLFRSEGGTEGQTPFDRAGARVAMSHAMRVDGRAAEADSWGEQARSLFADFEPEDRQVLERLLALA